MMRIIRIRLSDSLGVYRTIIERHPAGVRGAFCHGKTDVKSDNVARLVRKWLWNNIKYE